MKTQSTRHSDTQPPPLPHPPPPPHTDRHPMKPLFMHGYVPDRCLCGCGHQHHKLHPQIAGLSPCW